MSQGNPPATGGGGLFGGLNNAQPTGNAAGGLFGAVGFNAMGNNNPTPGQQGGLGGFGAQPQGGGGLFGNQTAQATTGGFFGQGTTPLGNNQGLGIFGGGGAQPGGLFGTNAGNNNNSFGVGISNAPSFNMGNQGGGLMGTQVGAGGTIAIPFDRAQTKRGNENCWVQSINAMPSYKDKVKKLFINLC